MNTVSSLALPVILTLTAALMMKLRGTGFQLLTDGIFDGVKSAVKLLPTLTALMVGVSMLSASGAVDSVVGLISPFCEKLGIPAGLLPLIIMRPVSGGASNAIAVELFEKYGPDSFTGRVASVMLGSSDTVIYIFAVYFSSAGIKKSRHFWIASMLTMLFCIFAAALISRLFFA